MRIVHINTKNFSGGAALVARTLHLAQKKLGLESTFIAGRGEENTEHGLITLQQSQRRFLGNVLGYRLTQIEAPLNHRLWNSMWDKFIAPADLIHLHNTHGYYLPDVILNKLLQKPTVWTLHDHWLLSGRCGFHGSCQGFLSGCTSCPHKNYYPKTWVDRARLDFSRKRNIPIQHCSLVTPSKTSVTKFISAGFNPEQIQTIPNPITLPQLSPSPSEVQQWKAENGIHPDKTCLLFTAANLDAERKGLPILVETMGRLKNREKIQLLLVGQLRSKPQLPILTHNIAHINDREHMAQIYHISDLVIIPSLEESYGMVGPEALSCGCDVLCNDLAVFRETMGDKATYVKGNSAPAYASHMNNYVKKEPSKYYGDWSAEIAAKRYMQLYEEKLTILR